MTASAAPAAFSTRPAISTPDDGNAPHGPPLGDDTDDLTDAPDWRPRVLASNWLGWKTCSRCGKPADRLRKCLPCFEDERRSTNTMAGGVVVTVQKQQKRGKA